MPERGQLKWVCLQVHDAMYEQDLLLGFPVPPLIRFVGQEDAFISNANGGPRIFFNIEDHQSYQTGMANRRFDVRPIFAPIFKVNCETKCCDMQGVLQRAAILWHEEALSKEFALRAF